MARKTYREPCGCTHDGHSWLVECEPHAAEHRETHTRAQADRIDGYDRDDLGESPDF